VDLDADGDVTAERVDCPVPRPLARIRGRLEDLLADPALAVHEQAWAEATLTDPDRPGDPMARHTACSPHPPDHASDPDPGRADQEIADDFVAHVRGAGPDEREQAVLRDAFDAVRADDAVKEVAR